MSTEDVLKHHLAAFQTSDVEETMLDYSEESIVIGPEGTARGLEHIRAMFSAVFSGLFSPGTFELIIDRSEVAGDVAYTVWHSTNQGVDVVLGTDTFLIRDGKIAVQTYAAKVEPKSV